MIVERLDIYDFELWVTTGEFELLKRIAECRNKSIEQVLTDIVFYGIQTEYESLD